MKRRRPRWPGVAIGIVVLPLVALAYLGFDLNWFRARERTPPTGYMSDEAILRQPAITHGSVSLGEVMPDGWAVADAALEVSTREAIAVLSLEIRTTGGRLVCEETATTFAARSADGEFRPDPAGDRSLISFPVITQAQKIGLKTRFALEGPADAELICRVRYFKLGPEPGLLRWDPDSGAYRSIEGTAEDGRSRNGETGRYAHALPAAEFRERAIQRPFEWSYDVKLTTTPPHDLFAARQRAPGASGPFVWLRRQDAWLIEGEDGDTRLVTADAATVLPGRLTAVVKALRERELDRPPFKRSAASIRVGSVRVTADTLLDVVKRLQARNLVIDGLVLRER